MTMETTRKTIERATRKEDIEIIFKSCDASLSGNLEIFEAQFGLQALGLYSKDKQTEQTLEELRIKSPLDVSAFRKIAKSLVNNRYESRLPTTPYTRCGLTLKQINALQSGLIETGWL